MAKPAGVFVNSVQRAALIGAHCVRSLRRPERLKAVAALRSTALRAHWFAPFVAPLTFPTIDDVLEEPSGLLAMGGLTTADSLFAAFEAGVFAANESRQPTMWWSPNERMVLLPENVKLGKHVKRRVRNDHFTMSFNDDFAGVIDGCAQPRGDGSLSWLAPMAPTYHELHRRGQAYSVEARDANGELVGGLFGLRSGRFVSIESMFAASPDASKVAVAYLCAHLLMWDYPLIDQQLPTAFLESIGGTPVPRAEFLELADRAKQMTPRPEPWAIEIKPNDDGAPIALT